MIRKNLARSPTHEIRQLRTLAIATCQDRSRPSWSGRGPLHSLRGPGRNVAPRWDLEARGPAC